MFRRSKENKAKLEHKLYLAREVPEPIFDLSDCGLRHVPQGIYSLCRVFLKEVLRLENNHLSSLSGGGQLKDLLLLKVLDLHHNSFVYLPDDIQLLKNLRELHLNDNQLKKLPETICNLCNLVVLNVANNSLKSLPENIGDLKNLKLLSVNGNTHLKFLPKSICKAHRLTSLEADPDKFIYPPSVIVEEGADAVRKYICDDIGEEFVLLDDAPLTSPEEKAESRDQMDAFEKQRLQDFLEMERANELLQKQEFELASAQKISKEKLLADITKRQNKLDKQLLKLQHEKEIDRFHLIEQVLEAEQNADKAIKELLEMTYEPLAQLLEQEKEEEERLIAAATKYNAALRTDDILADMQILLEQEMLRFQQFHESRLETSKNILEQEMENDSRVSEILQDQDLHKAELLSKLSEDGDLQKVAVGTLLERGDARSWGLLQQVMLVEMQLAALTKIEMDKRKLEIDQNLNDLCDKRMHLSFLLIDLLEQQKERRTQLLSTLETLEEYNDNSEDFWLKQYQRLLDKLPIGLSEAQKNIDPVLAQALLMNGAIRCLPFLANLTQCQYDVDSVTESDLLKAGIRDRLDRMHILDAFQMYKKEKMIVRPSTPTAPALPVEEASAPPLEQTTMASECVICLDRACEVIFVPCGHFCCCLECPASLTECPMCRTAIERKIRVINP